MEIHHRDRNGKNWVFLIDCTPEQADRIREALARLRNMGRAGVPSLSGIAKDEQNGPLYASVEAAMLRGLADAFPAVPRRQDPQPTPPRPQGAATAAPTPQPEPYRGEIPGELRTVADAADERPAYWWEQL